jgi:hypothetical protein
MSLSLFAEDACTFMVEQVLQLTSLKVQRPHETGRPERHFEDGAYAVLSIGRDGTR